MSLFLNTRGRASLGIAICDRCARKFPIGELASDPNAPGLKVCTADRDELDPYRLSARPPDNLTLRFVRPDVDLSTTPDSGDPGALVDANGNPFVLDESELA